MQEKITHRIHISGVVQGVGFRPFCVVLAKQYGIFGFVRNDTQGVEIVAQGTKESLLQLHKDLQTKHKIAKISHFSFTLIKNAPQYTEFVIAKSKSNAQLSAVIPADIALCDACLEEFRNPKNRRFLYAFISCTNCGARYSLINALPYDRKNTAMADFMMCDECLEEYHNPDSRRFHSEINCCEKCGPKLFFTHNLENFKHLPIKEKRDSIICKEYAHLFLENPLQQAIKYLKEGKILALKGVGGYALVCNALNANAIKMLRERKMRPTKPFALMCRDLEMAQNYVELCPKQKEILIGPIAPILLAIKKENTLKTADLIAPNLVQLGVILPYAPLHYLLFNAIDFPLIFTSANISGEPILKDFSGILEHLDGVCDSVLLFDRDILNPIDDSLLGFHNNFGDFVLRRARGFLSDITQNFDNINNKEFIALGAQQKVTFCLKSCNNFLLSSHLGDLETLKSVENFKRVWNLFCTQYKNVPSTFVFDLHSKYTQRMFFDTKNNNLEVQHHFAHFLSNIAENSIHTKTLGIIFDGTGYGKDGSIWGGEFLEWDPIKPLEYKRVAHFEAMVLLGGERAIKDIRRLGLEALFLAFGRDFSALTLPLLECFGAEELENFYLLHCKKSILCNSVGRLFDAISALCGIHTISFEGEGGMRLEALAMQYKTQKRLKPYPFNCVGADCIKVEIIPMLYAIVQDLQNGVDCSAIALRFHYTLGAIIKEIAKDYASVALSGGCFQNMLLTQIALENLADKKVHIHRKIPCNDGGVSVGQAYYASLKLKVQ